MYNCTISAPSYFPEFFNSTETFKVWVTESIDPYCAYDTVPTEFYQIEAEIRELYEELKTGDFLDITGINGGDAFSPVKYPIGIDGGNAFEPA